jgi:2-polyprenyl-6-methoxyphenol hydroxylase-like FAD-dependent oxidoreductase
MDGIGEHAVVLGASMGGLLAARVLSDFYDRVTVVERDVLSDGADARRGVPQSRQPHVLLARCGEIAEELFPGILDELVAAGAYRWDDGDLTRFHAVFGGHPIVQSGDLGDSAPMVTYHASRPFLECHVRRRVRALPNVRMLDGRDVVDLVETGGRVTGAVVHHRSEVSVTTLDAELVVDATGRGSRAPVFLDRMGYGRPAEDELVVNVAYASMPVRIPEGTLREHAIFRLFEPGRPRGFMMFRCERDTWMVGVGTLGEVEPPTTRERLLEFAEDLAPAHAFAAARAAEPLADVSVHRFPASRWRRYDRMSRTPDGLVVLGDAVCSFNPIYGQGMTIAAIEALILRDCLNRGDEGLPRRFHRAAAKKIRVAWQTAVGSDLALPEVNGPRPLSIRVTNAYLDRVLGAAEVDPVVALDFLKVVGMVEEPKRLMRPAFMLRVARAHRGRRAMGSGSAADAPALPVDAYPSCRTHAAGGS